MYVLDGSRMPARILSAALLLALVWISSVASAEESSAKTAQPCPASTTTDRYFLEEVWPKIAAQSCLTCHRAGGDAEDTEFVLLDPSKSQGTQRDQALACNRETFARIARMREKDQFRVLLKVVGGLDHGGKDVLKADSTGYKVLAEFVRRINAPAPKPSAAELAAQSKEPPFFEGVVMLDDRRLLRRALLSLAGRLPTAEELTAIDRDSLKAVPGILDAAMQEEAFFTRLREAFEDIFLTDGFDGVAETALSYDHFSKTRQWFNKYDLSHVEEKDRTKALYKITNDYRKAILGEPMKLIEYIVRNDRPFTELVTADYIMVTPYTSRGYGIYEEVKSQFKNTDDPFEYIPAKIKALVGREKRQDQESKTGFYPHSGILTTFQYLRRYPTTETNRNRLRTRMYYQHFLGIDVLELAARVSDAAAVTAKFQNPTMEAAECVVCHKTIDPVAGLFQDYYSFKGVYGRRKEGWYQDMFGPGLEGEDLPEEERWRALQWLGERTAKDPRFAVAMVEHVYYTLTGRKVLLPPKELDDPLYSACRRAYQAQRKEIEAIAAKFSQNGFNLKHVFKDMVLSDFYRADGVATVVQTPARKAELDDIGLTRLLAPEQVERKVGAIFGEPWNRLHDQLAMLYGGIDSKAVTERASDPSGAMGAIQRIMANDVACKNTLKDFARPVSERKLFPNIEPDVLPGESAEKDAAICRTIAALHERVLGRQDAPDSPEVLRTFQLFQGIVSDAHEQGRISPNEAYTCKAGIPNAPLDPHYTIRAWRGVITYLLRRQEFLYE